VRSCHRVVWPHFTGISTKRNVLPPSAEKAGKVGEEEAWLELEAEGTQKQRRRVFLVRYDLNIQTLIGRVSGSVCLQGLRPVIIITI
jgi:hypothetical protein